VTLSERLAERLSHRGLTLERDRLEALGAYVELLAKWNRAINLTGFALDDDLEAAFDRLVLEPLKASRMAGRVTRVLDVGSGGGSPAIPFCLGLSHSTELVLVEARARKAVFLREALRVSGIRGHVVAQRFEQVDIVDRFDAVTVRAVATDKALWAFVRRVLSPDGQLFWFHSLSQAQPQQDGLAWDPPIPLLDGDSRVSIGRWRGECFT
jgi:16S rRNA (guanine527-N7)-methyltransferase